jgi:hypothetical protein
VHVQLGLVPFHLVTEILGVSNRLHRHRSAANEAISTKKKHISQKALFHHDASHGIIGNETHHYNTSNTLSNPKFCAESVFDVGLV